MTPEQEKLLREMSFEEMSKFTLRSLNANDGRASNGGKRGGVTQGKVNAVNGHMLRIQKLADTVSSGKKGGRVQGNKTYTCPICGDFGKSNSWKQDHFHNCKGKVYQYDKTTNELVEVYSSTKQAIEMNGNVWNRQMINKVIVGKKKSAYGFTWERKL
jgi:hypothetical protein